ncbi:MAG: transposase, partial [bacterium]|nr:transposase [bacterium]
FCTVAQTGQFFDLHHRPGNVHDSNGAEQFMFDCVMQARREMKQTVVESRMDSAFFSQSIINELHGDGVFFTASVPFERFPQLKDMISQRKRWRNIDSQTSFFETTWKPKSWACSYRFIFVRTKAKKQRKGPLQLHLFEPCDWLYDYKVVVTNKTESAKNVVLFHNGRGAQEAIFGDAKNHAGLAVLPSRRLAGNQLYTLCAMMAHNLSREIQILSEKPQLRAQPKRPALWTFQKLDTLRHRIIQRAGRITRPHGNLTLTMSANQTVRDDLLHFMNALKKAA